MIRFLHTADWQIGKPFGGFDPELRGVLRSERVAAVARIAKLATARSCDAILVAGDVFDDNTVLDRDVNQTIEAMRGFSGPWILLPGNHDAALSVSVWTRFRRFADRAGLANTIVADKPEPIFLCDGRLAVLPAPLTRRHEAADVSEWFDLAETPANVVRVGLAHGSLANRLPEAAEAQNVIAEDRAARARLDYLALGDWHGFVEIAPKTVYAGTPEPDRYPANAPGHVAIVEIDAPASEPRIERVRLGRFDWRRITLGLHDDASAVEETLAALPSPAESLVQLTLSGSLPLRDRVALEASLEAWGARLFHLELDDAALVDEPDEDDLDEIDIGGFVRTAVERLKAKAQDPSDPQRAAAARALRMVYVEHRRLSGAAER